MPIAGLRQAVAVIGGRLHQPGDGLEMVEAARLHVVGAAAESSEGGNS